MKSTSNKIVLILVILLVASNAAWGVEYASVQSAREKAESELTAVVQNKNVLTFQKLFVEKVLKSDGAVDFNTRVELQNAVNATKNQSIIQAWAGFLSAKTEAEGQARVKDLLSLLASEVYVQ